MTTRLSTGLRTALAGTGAGFSGTFANGIINVYSGAQPANADAAITGTLLLTITLASGAFTAGTPTNGLTFAAAAAGVASKTGVWSGNGVAAGTAGWARFVGNAVDGGALSTTLPRMDMAVGTSGADLNLSNLAIVVGAPNTIDSFTFAIPAQ
jgi:hypothetical protein